MDVAREDLDRLIATDCYREERSGASCAFTGHESGGDGPQWLSASAQPKMSGSGAAFLGESR